MFFPSISSSSSRSQKSPFSKFLSRLLASIFFFFVYFSFSSSEANPCSLAKQAIRSVSSSPVAGLAAPLFLFAWIPCLFFHLLFLFALIELVLAGFSFARFRRQATSSANQDFSSVSVVPSSSGGLKGGSSHSSDRSVSHLSPPSLSSSNSSSTHSQKHNSQGKGVPSYSPLHPK